MKLAYPFLTVETTSPLMAIRGKEEVVCQQLKILGYTGIELLVRDPSQLDKESLKTSIDNNHLHVAAIGTAPIVSDDGLYFTSSDSVRREAAIKRVKEVIQLAAHYQCPISIGKLRGNLLPDNKEASYEWMCHCFREVGEYAAEYGIDIAIEPQNESNLNTLNTTKETIDFLHMMNIPSLKVMLDTYHMNISENSIATSLLAAKEHLIFMHVADDNRETPGKGKLSFQEIFSTLRSIDYEGFISMEISQKPTSYEAAKNAIDYLNNIK